MNGADVVRQNVANARNVFQGTVAGVTAAQANWLPPGEAHPVGERYAHILWGEDMIINQLLQGKQTIWERDGYGRKTGLTYMPQVTKEAA